MPTLVLGQLVSGGTANTIQFPPRSLNGFGNITDVAYGPKHIAIPSPSVSVGDIYILNHDCQVQIGLPRKNLSVGDLAGKPKNPGAGRYVTMAGGMG